MNKNQILAIYKQHLLTKFDSDETKAILMWANDYISPLSENEFNCLLESDSLLSFLPQKRIFRKLHQLLLLEPVQYVFETAYFHKYRFKVNSNTLIPRPETEELIELILEYNSLENNGQINHHPEHTEHHYSINGLDIGTGSGCIPITILLQRSNWKFESLDISDSALEVAKSNAIQHHVNDRLKFFLCDFLSTDVDFSPYNLIISNPPYIPLHEMSQLSEKVTQFEPHIALFTESDPLIFYKQILKNALITAKKGTQIWMETHQDYCAEVENLFKSHGSTKIIEDLSGNPRFIFFTT